MQQEKIGEQYELLNLIRVETTENRKLCKNIREWWQYNASFTVLPKETIILTYDKNFTMLQLTDKIAVLQGGLTQIQF